MARAAGRAHWCDPLAGSVDMTWVELGQVQRQRQRQRQGHSRASRTPEPPPLVAWASSPRNDHSPPEQRPHNGQDARRTTGSGDRGSGSDRFSGSQQHRARCGHGNRPRTQSPGSVTDRDVAGHLVLRCTGLPSRSALVAPPLRLAALRWREVIPVLGGSGPPPGVSTACLVAVAQFSGRPLPGEPHTVLCPSKLEYGRHNTVYCTPAGTRRFVLSGVGCSGRVTGG
jgi:hypothetical protein